MAKKTKSAHSEFFPLHWYFVHVDIQALNPIYYRVYFQLKINSQLNCSIFLHFSAINLKITMETLWKFSLHLFILCRRREHGMPVTVHICWPNNKKQESAVLLPCRCWGLNSVVRSGGKHVYLLILTLVHVVSLYRYIQTDRYRCMCIYTQ